MVVLFYFFTMFEKISKKFGNKTADNVIEGAKETLNDRLDKYSDIIQIGLVIGVIAFGGNKLLGHGRKQKQDYLPGSLDFGGGNGTPIVINNYYTQNERNPYRNQEKGAYHGRSGKGYQKH